MRKLLMVGLLLISAAGESQAVNPGGGGGGGTGTVTGGSCTAGQYTQSISSTGVPTCAAVAPNQIAGGNSELAVAYSTTPALNGTYLVNKVALTGVMSPTIAAGVAGQLPVCMVFLKASTASTFAVTYPANMLGGGQPTTGFLRAKQCFTWVPSDSAYEADGPMFNF